MPTRNRAKNIQAGKCLAAWLKAKGWTRRQLAEALGMSTKTKPLAVSSWIKGNARPKKSNREALRRLTRFDWDNPPNPQAIDWVRRERLIEITESQVFARHGIDGFEGGDDTSRPDPEWFIQLHEGDLDRPVSPKEEVEVKDREPIGLDPRYSSHLITAAGILSASDTTNPRMVEALQLAHGVLLKEAERIAAADRELRVQRVVQIAEGVSGLEPRAALEWLLANHIHLKDTLELALSRWGAET